MYSDKYALVRKRVGGRNIRARESLGPVQLPSNIFHAVIDHVNFLKVFRLQFFDTDFQSDSNAEIAQERALLRGQLRSAFVALKIRAECFRSLSSYTVRNT